MAKSKQHIILMIPNGEKWHYHKKLSALLRGITCTYYGDFYCLNCLYSFRTNNKLESYKIVCEKKDSCSLIMPSEDTNNWKFNQYQHQYQKLRSTLINLIKHHSLLMQILNA